MFRITDLKEIDFGVFLNLLLSMQVKISADEKYSSLPLEEVPEDYFGHDNFPKVKAEEIIEKLFTGPTNPIPGPTFPKLVATAPMEVNISRPDNDITREPKEKTVR